MTARFVTYSTYTDENVICLSADDFRAKISADPGLMDDWDEWVWQEAESKQDAIDRHDDCMAAYEADPTRQYY